MTNSVKLNLIVQYIADRSNLPTEKDFRLWVKNALAIKPRKQTELVIRIVDEPESASLNQQYRYKVGPTNILSFPCMTLPSIPNNFIGDLVICAPVVAKEAMEQNKLVHAHWAHIVIHGVLHLLGYDHNTELTANEMETLEQHILHQLNYPNPYLEALKTNANAAL